jgi:hypothetical protein
MNKIIATSLITIALLIVFLLGGGVGMSYQSQKLSSSNEKALEIAKILSSKAVSSIIVFGQVESINGKELNVSYEGESVVVKMTDTALIESLSKDGSGKPIQQKIDFNQIKQGDSVNIPAKLSQQGILEGESLIIFKY